jgi:hypothetical protein
MSLVDFWEDFYQVLSLDGVDKRYMQKQHERYGFVVYATEYGLYDRHGTFLERVKLSRMADDFPIYPSELVQTKRGQEVATSKLLSLSAAALSPLNDSGSTTHGKAMMRAQGLAYDVTVDRLLSLRAVPVEGVVVALSELDATIHIRNAKTLDEVAMLIQWVSPLLGRDWVNPMQSNLALDVSLMGVVPMVPDTPPSSGRAGSSNSKKLFKAALESQMQDVDDDWSRFWNDAENAKEFQHMIGNGETRAKRMMMMDRTAMPAISSSSSSSSRRTTNPLEGKRNTSSSSSSSTPSPTNRNNNNTPSTIRLPAANSAFSLPLVPSNVNTT